MLEDRPKVSIVLPTHNGSRYIIESLKSIRDQSMVDYECIIVDDASTDDTYEIVCNFICDDSRFKLISNETNQRLPMSLNIGFDNTCGEYLTWTSDDNIFLSNAIRDMSTFLDNNPKLMMVCANMLNIDEEGGVIKENRKYNEREMMIGNTVGACFMYRRTVLNELGGYNPSFFLAEDYEYWLRILKEYGEIGHIDKVLYLYRRHNNSLTATRINEIKKYHCKLLRRELDWILSRIRDDKSLVLDLFEMITENSILIDSEKTRFTEIMPELGIMRTSSDVKRLILYGAGRVCYKALEVIPNERIAFIVDKSEEKQGKKMNGIPIISIKEMLEIQTDYQIVIAVGKQLMLEVIQNLFEAGINQCITSNCYIKTLREND